MTMKAVAVAVVLLAAAPSMAATPAPVAAAAGTPQAAIDGLFAADRGFGAAAAKTDLVAGLSAMLDADVVMPLPTGSLARGKAAVMAAFQASPTALTSSTEWAPLGGGLSADGQHGFTFGYVTTRTPGKPDRPGKYLSYWVKRPEGWRVAAFKRLGRPAGEVSTAALTPVLPTQLVAPNRDTSTIAAYRTSLTAAEKGFSDEAQKIGLGPAFAKNGTSTAINLGRGPGFTIGSENIGREVAAGAPPLVWGADDALVASSGDLGVTWGRIRVVGPAPAGTPGEIPFFTIWRRESLDAPWRYVAE
jgi:ketosteroid isomerase-like protein